MSTTTRYYATFTYPGSFVSESSTREIADPLKVEVPKGAYAYKTFARTVAVIDGEELLGPPRDHSPETIYGEVYDVARVEREVPDNRILLSNMRCNGWAEVIRTASGRLVNRNPGDIVISPDGSHVL